MKNFIILITILAWASICAAQAPVANFSTSASGGCSPFKVDFKDLSTGNIEKYEWDLGNGTKSSKKDPSGFYVAPGIYTIKLTVSNASGSNTKTGSITVYEDPKPQISADKRTGCAPLQVQFTDKTDPGNGSKITSWLWDFGNGTQSTEQNPRVKYNAPGAFSVVLKVTNDKGCTKVITEDKYINVSPGVTLNFTNTQASVCLPPFAISFINNSTGSGSMSSRWEFGDGGTSTETSPTHTYQASGKYTVSLIGVDNAGCSDTLIRTIDLGASKTDFTVSSTLCANIPVKFTNASTPQPIKSLWEFPDGTTSTSKDAFKTFSTPGTYKIKLTNTYSGCTGSFEKDITISEAPDAAFSPSAFSNCSAPFTVNFKSTSINADKFIWIFGDGSTPLSTNSTDVSYTYNSMGSFFVKLIAINNSGCTDTLVSDKPISVGPPAVKISGLPAQGCVPLGVNPIPDVSSIVGIQSYEWDFGDGTTSTEKFPAHFYSLARTYNVRLTVKTVDGCSVTVNHEMKLGNHSVGAFTATPRNICAKDSVYFTNTSQPADAKYTWIFGDGGISTQYSPIYSYNDTGYFKVRLVIDNNGCIDTAASPEKYIYIKPPVVKFRLQPICDVPYKYNIVDESVFDKESEGKRTWLWKMPDGTTSDKQVPPPYTFPGSGTYAFTLTISNGSCLHTKEFSFTIVNKEPVIEYDKNTNCKPVDITFKAITPKEQTIVNYKWSLNGFDTTTQSNIFSYRFDEAGADTLKLVTIDDAGCANQAKTPIQINGPKAAYSRGDSINCKRLTASLKDESKAFGVNKITNWKWDLGDGTVIEKTDSTAVEHIYKKAGLYKVTLTIKDAAGCIDSTSSKDSVKITDIKADFTATENACLGFPVSFQNMSTGEFVSSTWDFGDSSGFFAMSDTGKYLYKDTGYYDLKLTISDAMGCTDSLVRKKYIHIAQPFASFEVTDSVSFCPPFDVQFKNTSQFFKDVEWKIGQETSKEINHRKLFSMPGSFDVDLKVTSPDGNCVATTSKNITVYNPEDAKLTYDPLKSCLPGLVNLSAFDNLAPVKFFWDFGDGNILDTSASKISHTYTDLGTFTPKIILTESSGCVVTIEGKVPIEIKGAKAKFDVEKKFFCDSGLINILDSTVFNDPIVAYNWDFGDGTVSNEKSPQHNYKKEGLYNILLNVKTASGCVDSARLATPIKIVKAPVLTIAGDSLICIDERIKHTGFVDRPDSLLKWNWQFPNGASSTLQNPSIQQYKKAGNFQIKTILTNSSGCADTASQDIKVSPNPTVILPEVLTIPLGGSVLLPAQYSDVSLSYTWTPDTSLNCKDCSQPVASPKYDTKYSVTFVDENGCINKGEVKVIVLCKGVNVFLPNTFSPNSDGVNDVFYVRGQGLDRIKFLRVFNRWGEVVFEQRDFVANNPLYGWNGQYKGFKAQPDVYIYQAELFCGNSEVIKLSGNVALIQ